MKNQNNCKTKNQKPKNCKTKNQKLKSCKTKNRRARPLYLRPAGQVTYCPVYCRTCCCQGVSHPLLDFLKFMIIYTALCLFFFFFSAKSQNLAKVGCSPAGYQLMFFKFSLPMVLCWRASRAAAPPWQTDQRNRSNFVMSEFIMALHYPHRNYFWNSSSTRHFEIANSRY